MFGLMQALGGSAKGPQALLYSRATAATLPGNLQPPKRATCPGLVRPESRRAAGEAPGPFLDSQAPSGGGRAGLGET